MHDTPRPGTPTPHAHSTAAVARRAWKLVAIYATWSSLWILFSDRWVEAVFRTPGAITTASMVKGWFFIAVTATLLFTLARSMLLGQQHALQLAKERAEQLRATLDALPDLLFEVGYDGLIHDYHSNRHELLVAPPERFLGRHLGHIVPPEVSAVCLQALEEAAQNGISTGKRYAIDLAQGERWFELSVAPMRKSSDPAQDRYIMIARDVTSIKDQQRRLEYLQHFDPVTDLPNRLLLADRLTQAMHHAQRRQRHVAVAYLDLDGFQAINDQHGRGVGDQVLIAVAKRLKQAMRTEDTLARIGGDEFALVFVDLENTHDTLARIEHILQLLAQEVHIGSLRLQVSACAGVSYYPQQVATDADQLLRQADQAMYQAKLLGKGLLHVFDEVRDHDIRGHNEFREQIRLALERGEFVLYYQPKVHLPSGRVIGLEALIRWQHPERGLLSPAAFLPEIEDHALAIAVGEWTLREAMAQVRQWRGQGLDQRVSVNIGARQLQSPDFFDRFMALNAQFPDLEPGCIELEILETSAIQDLSAVCAVIERFAAIGVVFALDDFGTGYSSLSYLKRLQVPTIKIDQSFVRDMLANPLDQAILQAIIGLAQALGRSVIAEGVETLAHGQRLIDMGCPLAQGYAIARPMPAQSVPGWVRHYPLEWHQSQQRA
ncbi:MAG: putative bifunctional diguanylate cyclase/phosphodiesterase [Rhodoferax sp.]